MNSEQIEALLGKKARASLGFYPTPLYKLKNLSKDLGINLYIKREDFSGQSLFGGNKIRKLEYLIGDAKGQGAEYVFTYGATQSNHAMQTVEACRKEGLKPVLYLLAIVEPDEKDLKGNLLLDKVMGAEIHVIKINEGESEAEAEARMYRLGREHIARLEAEGHKCYDIPMGGASIVGTAGFIGGFVELQKQLDQMKVHGDYLFHANGTGGTMAGLVAGKKLIGSSVKIVSVDVMFHDESYKASRVQLGNDTLRWLGLEPILTADDFSMDSSYYLPGYEMPSKGGTEAIKMMAEKEGLLLDPVYSGKGFAGLIDYVRSGRVAPGSNVVFLHTGGSTALFAEKEILGELLI